MQIKIILAATFLVSFLSFPQVNNKFAETFIKDLVNNNSEKYILPGELRISQRLGISYDSVDYKYLISYDIDEEIKAAIKSGFSNYNIKIENEGDNFSTIIFTIPAQNYDKRFYFRDSLLISPPQYYSGNWSKSESKYFIFLLSDQKFFNSYCADKLDKFVEATANTLGFTKEELSILEKEKIYYFLCKDEKEIKQLTGYESRGNYILAYDYIVTTYNCHYHELVHLLMNYKLKHIPLYTHPFLQEGLAVALGGRGGLDPGVVLNLGKFLSESEILNYNQLLNSTGYRSIDPSMSYPLSGLYNLFLINELGIENYENIYRKYSGNNNFINSLTINDNDVPGENKWKAFLTRYKYLLIEPGISDANSEIIYKSESCNILENKDNYLFEAAGNIIISFGNSSVNYTSKKFIEEFPGNIYNGEKYLINISATEISLYNLYTNNLLANYAAGFSIDMKQVSSKAGKFIFTISKSLFEEDLKNAIITK